MTILYLFAVSLAIVALLALAPKEIGKILLSGVWLLLILSTIASVLWGVVKAIFRAV